MRPRASTFALVLIMAGFGAFGCSSLRLRTETAAAFQNLVNNSDYIVLGTLRGAGHDPVLDLRRYDLELQQIIWGDLFSYLFGEIVGAERISFYATEDPWSGSADSAAAANGTGIWILQRDPAGNYWAGAGSYQEVDARTAIQRVLRKQMIILRSSPRIRAEDRSIDIIYRNAWAEDGVFRFVKLIHGTLQYGPSVDLQVETRTGSSASWVAVPVIAEKVVHMPDDHEIILQPGDEQLIRLALPDFFAVQDNRRIRIRLSVTGVGETILELQPSGDLPIE